MAGARRNARRQPPTLRVRLAALRPTLLRLARSALTATALFALGMVIYLAYDALRSMPVERIVVAGKLEHLRQEALRESLAGKLDEGLLLLDLRELRDELEALPWVYSAQLRRRFPDTLELWVIEQRPIARWGEEGFLNHEGRIIEVADAQRWQHLPQLRGPQGSAVHLVERYQELLARLGVESLYPRSLTEDQLGQLRVILDNGVELQLGDRDFHLRMQRFLKLWREELGSAGAAVARVDMRYDRGAAVAFAAPPQLAGLTTDSEGR